MVSPWSASIVLPFSKNQYCPIVVDVGARRPGEHQGAGVTEEPVAVMPLERVARAGPAGEGGRPHRACVVFAAVDAVGIGRDRPALRVLDPQREQELGAAAAATA